MAVLVTGGAGYIGSHMVRSLLDAGETPVVVDNFSTGFDWLVPEEVPLVTADVGDLATIEAVIEAHGIDAVIHFAGSIIVPESVADPLKYYRNNTAASRSLIEACVNKGVGTFIFSSTAAVYGDPVSVPVDEDAPLAPLSPYGTSKLMTELMLRDVAAAHAFRYTALRYFNVAGADPEGRTGQATKNATHLIKVACETALGKRDEMAIFGTDYATPDGTGVRDYIHVSDLVEAHRLALSRLRTGGDSLVMNCGYGEGYSVRQVIDAVKAVSGIDFAVRIAPRRAGDSPRVVAASERVRRELGWVPHHDDLETIVRHALAWEQSLTARNRL
ncbi:UDP-glucose 4-epimerase GalE [Polymorphum gilvum]|uniref:UDP-glucose 4-epimerase n=1 Tax=Polymorphum gilvum (strain LMG 25793 / CGMCC 1.9160 / SL003B-26A1) TaxID=991905 RepID=F2IW68_POLGS|nr:UDP-glucose 4-epimerase GalE [Polymorphum gilvum]ADZ71453.1 UDP-glucose 4-epimerase (UDP-galactose 4-epimerase) (Galactowaldenase) [Polymorphum gilvum SL003B-26A1]